jgi:hypothetical protein
MFYPLYIVVGNFLGKPLFGTTRLKFNKAQF